MAKRKSQTGKPKQGLPRLMELAMTKKAPMVGAIILSVLATVASFVPYLAIYFVIQEIVGVYPDVDALNVETILGHGVLALSGVLVNVLFYTASVAFSHIAAYGSLCGNYRVLYHLWCYIRRWYNTKTDGRISGIA